MPTRAGCSNPCVDNAPVIARLFTLSRIMAETTLPPAYKRSSSADVPAYPPAQVTTAESSSSHKSGVAWTLAVLILALSVASIALVSFVLSGAQIGRAHV